MCSSCGPLRSFCLDCATALEAGACPDYDARNPTACGKYESLIDLTPVTARNAATTRDRPD